MGEGEFPLDWSVVIKCIAVIPLLCHSGASMYNLYDEEEEENPPPVSQVCKTFFTGSI